MDDTPKMETAHGRVRHGGSMVEVPLAGGGRLAFWTGEVRRVGQIGTHRAGYAKGTAFIMFKEEYTLYYLAPEFTYDEVHELLNLAYIAFRHYSRKQQAEDWEAAKQTIARQGQQGSPGMGH